jgi:hypothetical protein
MICGMTTKSYNRIFLKMLVDLRNGPPITRDLVRQHLLSLVGPTAEWPTDEHLRGRWLTTPVYQTLRQARAVMVLEAIEWLQYTNKQEHQRPPSTTAYSVEHIMPQSTNGADWPLHLPDGIDDATRHALLTARETLKHTFGNLTLVTAPMNSALSNGPFAAKSKELTDKSTLMLNRYFSTNGISTWDEAAIRERGERLFAQATKIWPRPE